MKPSHLLSWALFLCVILLLTSFTVNAKPVALLFGESITEQMLNPSAAELTEVAKGGAVSKEMALAQFRHRNFADIIIERISRDYATTQNIVLNQALVEQFIARFGTQLPSDTQKAQAIAQKQTLRWQIDKALYEQFSGAVVFRQSNPQMPVEAYLKLLQEYQTSEQFRIVDRNYAAIFWSAFSPPYAMTIAPERIDFSKPWWLNN